MLTAWRHAIQPTPKAITTGLDMCVPARLKQLR